MPAQAQSGRTGAKLLLCFVLVVALGYLSLDGHHTGLNLFFQGDLLGNCFDEIDDNITWLHGWPITCYVRNSLDTVKINRTPRLIDFSDYQFSSWPFDAAPLLAFHTVGLILDFVFLIALTAATWQALSCLNLPPIRFGIKTLLGVTAVVAAISAAQGFEHRIFWMFLSFMIVGSALLACGWATVKTIRGKRLAFRTRTVVE